MPLKNISHRYLDSGKRFPNFAFAFSGVKGSDGLERGSTKGGKRSYHKVL
jgi:hypothetical protein